MYKDNRFFLSDYVVSNKEYQIINTKRIQQ